MPRSNICSALPPELLTEIASHMDRCDLCRLVNVNSSFQAVARQVAKPFAYNHGTITAQGGLRFPLASQPYLFQGEGGIDAVNDGTLVQDESMAALAKRVKRLDIKPHTFKDCEDFANCKIGLRNGALPCYHLNLEVLNIQFYFPQHPNKHNDPQYWYHTDSLPEHDQECHYLLSLIKGHSFKQIIVKDIPRYHRPQAKSCHLLGKIVSVLYSQTSLPAVTERDTCKYNHGLGFHALEMVGLAAADELVIVFWTERPGEVWIPPCRHQENRNAMWSHIAQAALDYDLDALTLVNAGAVLPSGAKLEEHAARVRHHVGDPHPLTEQEHRKSFEKAAREILDFPRNFDCQFMTMEEWIWRQRGSWTDTFSPPEVEPWLVSMRDEGVW